MFMYSLLYRFNCNKKGKSNVVNTTITNLRDSDPNIRFKEKHEMWATGTSSPYGLKVN